MIGKKKEERWEIGKIASLNGKGQELFKVRPGKNTGCENYVG